MPREQLTLAQRRLKWVKVERLPLYLQELLNKKKKKDRKEKPAAKDAEDSEVESSDSEKATAVAAGEAGEKEDRETVLSLKNDFNIDYTKNENVYSKLREILEERLKGKKHVLHHAKLLSYMLDFVKDPRQRLEILMNLLNAIFASAKTATATGFLSREAWVGALTHVNSLLVLLNDPNVKTTLTLTSKKSTQAAASDEPAFLDGNTALDIEKSILPSLVSFL